MQELNYPYQLFKNLLFIIFLNLEKQNKTKIYKKNFSIKN